MKVLFYSLNAAIWLHALPENRLVKELGRRGFETVYVSCEKSFSGHCTSMSAYGVDVDAPPAQKSRICDLCVENARLLTGANRARHLRLIEFVNDQDRAKIVDLMAAITHENYLDFQYLGVEVGRLATYELFLKYKKMSFNLTEDEWSYFRIYVENCLVSLIGFSRIVTDERPDVVFFYSPQYGTNGVCARYAELQGVKTVFVEGSSSNSERYGALRIWDWAHHGLVNPALTHWSDAKSLLTKSDVVRVGGHLHELLKGVSFAVYSPSLKKNFSLREYYKLPSTTKVVLLTLSSYDEAYAAYVIRKFPERKVQSSVFTSQIEWVSRTMQFLADRDDVAVIVRVHPRDFPNKRESVRAEQASLWEELLRSTPSNVFINWPQDGISLYDLFREVDVIATGWSATGMEALALGIPVVTYDRFLPSYPSDIHLTGESEAQYFQNIDLALRQGRSFDNVMGAYRWLAASFSLGTVRISPPIMPEDWKLAPWRPVRRVVLSRPFRRLVKWFDARRSFGFSEDAERFFQFLSRGAKSLYEVVGSRQPSRAGEAALDAVVKREYAAFYDALGPAVPLDRGFSLSAKPQSEEISQP